MSLVTQITAGITAIGVFCKRLKHSRIQPSTTQAFTTTTLTNMTGMSFAAVAGRTYRVKLFVVYSTNLTINGIGLGYTFSGTGSVWGVYHGDSSAAGATLSKTIFNTTAGLVVTAAPATTGNLASAEFYISATTAGTFQIQARSEVAGTITTQTSSAMFVNEIV